METPGVRVTSHRRRQAAAVITNAASGQGAQAVQGRAPSLTWEDLRHRKHSRTRPVTGAVCDVCGTSLPGEERLRLVWKSGLDGDLVLADLCARCARESDRFLAMHGGRGREAVELTQERFVSAAEPAPGQLHRVGGMIVRGLVYVLIALATFVVITAITSVS